MCQTKNHNNTRLITLDFCMFKLRTDNAVNFTGLSKGLDINGQCELTVLKRLKDHNINSSEFLLQVILNLQLL